MTDTLVEAEEVITEAVQPVLRQFRRHVFREDLVQECWLWIYEHLSIAQTMLAEDKRSALRFRLRRVAERYARREKAERDGYGTEDEVFYSVRMIQELLPDALDPAATPSTQTQEIQVSASREGYGEWEAAVADLRNALASLSDTDRELLVMYQAGTAEQVGRALGISADAVYSRLGRVMRRLQRHLGGANPWRE